MSSIDMSGDGTVLVARSTVHPDSPTAVGRVETLWSITPPSEKEESRPLSNNRHLIDLYEASTVSSSNFYKSSF